MGVKAKASGIVVGLLVLTVLMLVFIWAVAKIGMILTGFIAGLIIGLCCGMMIARR